MRGTLRSLIVPCMAVLGLCLLLGACAKKSQVPPEEAVPGAGAPQEGIKEGEVAPGAGAEGEVSGETAGLEDIHFDYDQYNIRPDAREILAKNYAILKGMANAKVLIEGHCDERGAEAYNMALGQRRADATRDYLVTLGLSSSQISTISYGKDRPLDPGHDEEAHAKNRRAHFVISR